MGIGGQSGLKSCNFSSVSRAVVDGKPDQRQPGPNTKSSWDVAVLQTFVFDADARIPWEAVPEPLNQSGIFRPTHEP